MHLPRLPRPSLLAFLLLPTIAPAEEVQDAYDTQVVGLWQGDGGTCDTLVGSWEFGPDTIRGNATSFALTAVYGTADRLVLPVVTHDTGAGMNLIVTLTGLESLAIKGPGIAADVIRCHPDRPGDDIMRQMEQDAAAFDAAKFKPIRLSGLTCGDNCYVDFTEQREGAADLQFLCLAPECADWIDAGAVPAGFVDVIVGAVYGTGQQVDSNGTVMTTDFPAIVAFGPPDTGPDRLTVPLQPGLYVDPQIACDGAPDAAIREYTGGGFGGPASRDCEFYAPVRNGDTFKGMQTCTNADDGQRSTTPLTVTVTDTATFALTQGPGDTRTFRFCSGDD